MSSRLDGSRSGSRAEHSGSEQRLRYFDVDWATSTTIYFSPTLLLYDTVKPACVRACITEQLQQTDTTGRQSTGETTTGLAAEGTLHHLQLLLLPDEHAPAAGLPVEAALVIERDPQRGIAAGKTTGAAAEALLLLLVVVVAEATMMRDTLTPLLEVDTRPTRAAVVVEVASEVDTSSKQTLDHLVTEKP